MIKFDKLKRKLFMTKLNIFIASVIWDGLKTLQIIFRLKEAIVFSSCFFITIHHYLFEYLGVWILR